MLIKLYTIRSQYLNSAQICIYYYCHYLSVLTKGMFTQSLVEKHPPKLRQELKIFKSFQDACGVVSSSQIMIIDGMKLMP